MKLLVIILYNKITKAKICNYKFKFNSRETTWMAKTRHTLVHVRYVKVTTFKGSLTVVTYIVELSPNSWPQKQTSRPHTRNWNLSCTHHRLLSRCAGSAWGRCVREWRHCDVSGVRLSSRMSSRCRLCFRFLWDSFWSLWTNFTENTQHFVNEHAHEFCTLQIEQNLLLSNNWLKIHCN